MKWLGIALAIGTLALMLALANGNKSLITGEAPRGGLSLEFPSTPKQAHEIIRSWDALDQLPHAKAHIRLDFAFIPFYSGLMIFICLALRSPRCRKVAVPAAFAATVAGLLDVVENFGMLSLIDRFEKGADLTTRLVDVVFASATTKFALLLLSAFAIVALAVCRVVSRPRSSSR